ncbi:hypothetical protein U1Q18_032800 [Sarracenia purpurea var. burkii]
MRSNEQRLANHLIQQSWLPLKSVSPSCIDDKDEFILEKKRIHTDSNGTPGENVEDYEGRELEDIKASEDLNLAVIEKEGASVQNCVKVNSVSYGLLFSLILRMIR